MTSIDLRATDVTRLRTDVLVLAAAEGADGPRALGPGEPVAAALGAGFDAALTGAGFTGKPGQVATFPTAGAIRAPLLIAVGVGDADAMTPETLRRAAGAGMRAVHKATSVAVAVPSRDEDDVQAICEGVGLGSYDFDAYRSTPSADGVDDVVVIAATSRAARRALANAQVVVRAVARARDWVNTPPRDLRPPDFAAAVGGLDAPARLKVGVWDEKRLAAERCGGILGVGQGSSSPPRLVRLDYRPRKPAAHLALVGKGITYDSGGLTIKNSAGLMTMKCDMAGAAAVVAATFAIAELGLPVQVTALAAMAENMPSGTATRPGDVLSIRGGQTVEVLNTDAEGRLVLADALVLAAETDPDVVVDVATLTGACVVALGGRTAGVMGNDEPLAEAVTAAGRRAGEEWWRLPIPEEMKAKVSSSAVADLRQHNPDTSGGALFAAAFLREFVTGCRWAHLDIAGPAFHEGDPYGYVPKGGTGFATRTLIRLAQDLTAGAGWARAIPR